MTCHRQKKHDSGLSSCSADYHDNETDDSIDVGVPASSSPQPSEQSKVSNSIGGEPPFTELKKKMAAEVRIRQFVVRKLFD